jgi:uncharacterized protein
MTRLLLAILAFYKRWLSPALHAVSPGGCKFLPTCSEYAAAAIATHGPLRGCALACWRLLRCHPFSPGGYDPVPGMAKRVDRISPSAAPATGSRCSAGPCQPEPLPLGESGASAAFRTDRE